MTMSGYWRDTRIENRRATLNQYGQINNVWIIAPNGTPVLGGFARSPSGSFSSFTDLKPKLRSRDLIYLFGVLREQVVTPDDVYDVTVLGAANTPRQATDGGLPTGGGATWMPPSSGATATRPLIEVVRQGWTFQNIAFNPHTASAGIRFTSSGGLLEAGQGCVDGCLFTGGGTTQIGIEDNGGSGMIQIVNSVFRSLGDTAIKGLTTAEAIPSYWQILNNNFGENLNDVKMSLSHATIQGNNFTTAGSGATNKVVSTIALTGQGLNNHVVLNFFHNTTGQIQISNGYSGSSTDMWANYCIGTAALIVSSPPGA